VSAPKSLTLRLLPGEFSICQLPADRTEIPRYLCLIREDDETTSICPSEDVPPDTKCEPGWRVLKIAGPFEFSETGILSAVLEPLARYAVPILAFSTFNTDLVFVKQKDLARATEALRSAGHILTRA
jgi:hypothetical protein